MLNTYQGYFQNGRFMPSEPVEIPDNVTVHVTIVGELPQTRTKAQRQGEALEKLLAALGTINNEPLDEEFDEILTRGISAGDVDL